MGLLAGWVRSKAPEAARTLRERRGGAGRVEAWGELLPKLDEFYPAAAERADAIAPRAVVLDADRVGGRIRPRQRQRTRVTNVTVRLYLVHFLSAPHPFARHVYFVPRRPGGRSIDLPTGLVPNVPTADSQASRPFIAIPAHATTEEILKRRPSAHEVWLKGVGGVVDFRVEAWSMEVRQPEGREHPNSSGPPAATKSYHAFRLASGTYFRAFLGRPSPAGETRPASEGGQGGPTTPDPQTAPAGPTIPPEGFKAAVLVPADPSGRGRRPTGWPPTRRPDRRLTARRSRSRRTPATM